METVTKLKFWRLKRGVQQFALAEGVGIHESLLSRIEKGWVLPNPETLKRIGEILDVSTEDLTGEITCEIGLQKRKLKREAHS